MQSRRMMVLRAVVEDYIRSQEPVGSASLTKNHHLGVSSATIRNDMSALEEEGYLVQPHTSAGRIPTEKGYRYFVDGLASIIPLSEAQRRGIRNFLSGSVSLQDTLQRSARLLASITGQIALVASPSLSKSRVRHIELVQVSESTLLAVIITDTGSVAQHMLPIGNIHVDDFSSLTTVINNKCVNAPFDLAARYVRDLSLHIDDSNMRIVISSLAAAIDDMYAGEHAHDLYVAGASQLAHKHHANDFAQLFDALEEQAVIMRLMTSLSEEASDCVNGVSVAIGSETHTPELLNASVVTSGYGYDSSIECDESESSLYNEDNIKDSSNEDSSNEDSSNEDATFSSSTYRSKTSNRFNESNESKVLSCDYLVKKENTKNCIDNICISTLKSSDDYKKSSNNKDISDNSLNNTSHTNVPVAFIGSIGPQHMDYAVTMSAVRAVARYLNTFISHNS